jgi:8-oxo-dGTP pyrophosphatase MutT (NUDIX family)
MSTVRQLVAASFVVAPERWKYESENQSQIERFWKKACEEKPALHNGEVYMLTQWSLKEDRLEGVVQPATYASFLHWRDRGYPETGARNCFGSSILLSREGHLLFGRMASHTATAGLVYPIGGSFGEEDVNEQMLHVETNIERELLEETGLRPKDAQRQEGYVCVEEGPRIALAAIFRFDCTSGELRQRIQSYLHMCDDPELDEMVIFRRRAFARHHRMPEFARVLIDHFLPQ